MKVFTAIWGNGKREVNILCTKVVVEEDVVFLYTEEKRIGQFDMGILDIWFVKNDREKQRRNGSEERNEESKETSDDT